MEPEQILEAARRGDESAWAELYRSHAPVLLGYLRTRGASDPEDLLGEVFLQAGRDLATFRGSPEGFRSWLFTIARNRLIDEGRRSARRVAEVLREPPTEIQTGDVEAEAFEALSEGDVRDILASLPTMQQDVVLMRILGGMTIAEIASVLGKRPGAVKALQRRALVRLRKKIEGTRTPPGRYDASIGDD